MSTPSEIYAEQLNNHDPSYYSQVPGIIFHCTYLVKSNGKTIRKKISSTAIALYTLIKQLGGNREMSWASTETYARYLGKSFGAIHNAKKELQQPIEQLHGKPLIEVEQKRKARDIGTSPYQILRNTHIWPENNAYMRTLKHQPEYPLGEVKQEKEIVHNSTSLSNSESETASLSNSESEPLGSLSNSETIYNQYQKKNHSDKESEDTASRAGCSFDKSISDFSDESVDSVEVIKRIDRWKSALRKSGADENFINEIQRGYTLSEIENACTLVRTQVLKKNKIKNLCGYFRKILKEQSNPKPI